MQKFNYTPTNPFSGSLSSLAIGAGMVIVPLVYPFGIRCLLYTSDAADD